MKKWAIKGSPEFLSFLSERKRKNIINTHLSGDGRDRYYFIDSDGYLKRMGGIPQGYGVITIEELEKLYPLFTEEPSAETPKQQLVISGYTVIKEWPAGPNKDSFLPVDEDGYVKVLGVFVAPAPYEEFLKPIYRKKIISIDGYAYELVNPATGFFGCVQINLNSLRIMLNGLKQATDNKIAGVYLDNGTQVSKELIEEILEFSKGD